MFQSKSSRSLKQILIGLLFLMLYESAYAQSSTDLSWKMAFLKWTGTEYEAQPFVKPIKLAEGNEFQLFFMLSEPAYMYIVIQNANGKLKPLVSSAIVPGIPQYLPSEDNSYTITPPAGTEKLHVVVSRGQQRNLERLLDSLAKSPEDQKVIQLVLDEIAVIRQASSNLAEDPGKPSPMGGVRRGTKPVVATEFQGMNTYVKTIRIEH